MLSCKDFYTQLQKQGIKFYTGVPDSLLKDITAYITDHADKKKHIIAANEGNAIALASGYYVATEKPALVYMQNSGLGNAINPLTSLTDKELYRIPVLLLIGWRGEPGIPDEPQHTKQGKITQALLNTLEIPFSILPDSIEQTESILDSACTYLKKESSPYAFIVRKNTFEPYTLTTHTESSLYELSRESALQIMVDTFTVTDIVVSTTGKTSRELFEYREAKKQSHEQDFLTVGSMGHCSQLALTLALEKPAHTVYCLDGDGALIMHMGSLAIIGTQQPPNFKHIVLNNGAHCSVGGQPTCSYNINIPALAKACGYKTTLRADTKEALLKQLRIIQSSSGPALLEIRVHKGARKDLGRPTTTPIKNKKDFMKFIQKI